MNYETNYDGGLRENKIKMRGPKKKVKWVPYNLGLKFMLRASEVWLHLFERWKNKKI